MTDKKPPLEDISRHDPWDLSIEQHCIGACLLENANIDTLAAQLEPETFYDPYHQRLTDCIYRLHGSGAVSVRTVTAEMKTDPGFVETGGEAYLEAMRLSSPSRPPLREYTVILKDLWVRREMMRLADDMKEGAHTAPHEISSQTLAGEATDRLLALTGSYRAERTQALSVVTQSRLELAEKRLAGEVVPRLSTGLDRLDRAMGGLQPGDHLILAGRSGSGKTGLLCALGQAVALQGAPVMAISADMTKERWGERTLTGVDFMLRHGAYPIRYGHFRGKMGVQAISRLAEAQQIIAGWAYDICDEGEITVSRIRAKVRAMANRHKGKQGVLLTDFLQKIQADTKGKDRRRDEDITAVTYAIGDIAKDVGWTAISLAQLKNKDTAANGKMREDPPTETDIRESGGILMAADSVIAIHRKAFFVERREPPGRDFSPEPPADWKEWNAELNVVRNDLDLIGFKNRDDSISRLNMRLWCDMGSNAILDARPRDWPKPAGAGDDPGLGLTP